MKTSILSIVSLNLCILGPVLSITFFRNYTFLFNKWLLIDDRIQNNDFKHLLCV
jgi:hypothetical protein